MSQEYSPGHFLAAAMQDAKRRDDEIQHTYELPLAVHAAAQGHYLADCTLEQYERLEALKIGGNLRAARGLIWGQLLFDTARIKR